MKDLGSEVLILSVGAILSWKRETQHTCSKYGFELCLPKKAFLNNFLKGEAPGKGKKFYKLYTCIRLFLNKDNLKLRF